MNLKNKLTNNYSVIYLMVVGVTPVNSKLNGSRNIILSYGPVMLEGHQTPCEEIEVIWFYKQAKRITSKNIFFTH